MLVSQLITRAWFYTGIVQRESQTADDTQSEDGLIEFNSLLTKFNINGGVIPYLKHVDLPLITGQQIYEVPNLRRVDVLAYNLGDVRYALRGDNKNNYFGSVRVNNINSLPYQYYTENYVGGTRIYLYFLPIENLVLNITGIYGFPKVIFSTELDTVMDGFFQDYLVFKLAKRLCDFYLAPTPKGVQDELDDYEDNIEGLNPVDLTCNVKNMYSSSSGNNFWTWVNFNRGWIP